MRSRRVPPAEDLTEERDAKHGFPSLRMSFGSALWALSVYPGPQRQEISNSQYARARWESRDDLWERDTSTIEWASHSRRADRGRRAAWDRALKFPHCWRFLNRGTNSDRAIEFRGSRRGRIVAPGGSNFSTHWCRWARPQTMTAVCRDVTAGTPD